MIEATADIVFVIASHTKVFAKAVEFTPALLGFMKIKWQRRCVWTFMFSDQEILFPLFLGLSENPTRDDRRSSLCRVHISLAALTSLTIREQGWSNLR